MYDSEPATSITAWQQGDEQAVHTIFNTYYPRAVRLAVLSGLKMEDAQDCAQEAFLRAFERRSQLRDPVAFPLWFHRIITHHILDALHKRQRSREMPLETALELTEDGEHNQAPQPDELVIVAEGRSQLWRSVQMLSAHYRLVVVLRYYGDFSLREVATLMGKREGTVRVMLHRALQQLRSLSQQQSVAEQPILSCNTSPFYGG